MSKHVKELLRMGQRGFTLIELVAVMAILAILVAVVAPSVTDSRDASVRAQANADAKQVGNLAAEYFGKQNKAEVRTPHTTPVGALADDVGSNQQETSTRWPEKFITATDASGYDSAYATEFEPTDPATVVVSVTLLQNDNETDVTAADFLTKFTAVDFYKLGGDTPGSATQFSAVTAPMTSGSPVTVSVKNFLWLFQKGTSGSGLADDIRTVAVFQLTGTEINEGDGTVKLSYKQIVGGVTPS